jgi:hypothetical protein
MASKKEKIEEKNLDGRKKKKGGQALRNICRFQKSKTTLY